MEREDLFAFIDRLWRRGEIPYGHDIGDWDRLVDRAFRDISAGKTHNRAIIFRTVGQSGSGKSTQLMPAVRAFFEANSIEPVHLAVRNFATYHPFYEQLLENYGRENIRENTNAFALRLLFLTLERLAEEKFPMIFEMAILEPVFEKFVHEALFRNGYDIKYHIMAVPKVISDGFIENRRLGSGPEGKRRVLKSSSDYFDQILEPSLEYLLSLGGVGQCVVWNACNPEPVRISSALDRDVLDSLKKHRSLGVNPGDEESLRQAKIDWIIKNTTI